MSSVFDPIVFVTPGPVRVRAGAAWSFGADNGYQGLSDKDLAWYAVAVHPGDVAAVPEPEPQTLALALALLALGATVVTRRRRPTWGSALSAAQG